METVGANPLKKDTCLPNQPAAISAPHRSFPVVIVDRGQPGYLKKLAALAGVSLGSPESLAATLPFSCGDATAGTENEYQVAVIGGSAEVDLPNTIRESGYCQNMRRRTSAGDTPGRIVSALERYLEGDGSRVWENSWVRFPRGRLNAYADAVFQADLRADRSRPAGPLRGDAGDFAFTLGREAFVRIPVSYLLKLALADAVGDDGTDPMVRSEGVRAMGHFLSDNTSPETFSFCPVRMGPEGNLGDRIAAETALRFVFCQLLLQYANARFGLVERGQKAVLYFAPHPPVRQRQLNDLIADNFYRSLFINPCLSGWPRGEDKHRYMTLCHEVLSRSQLNAVAKLKEAGIIVNNLVVLPNTSNISLANNGTHLSIGSLRLSRLFTSPESGFGAADEKYVGDLAIKIVEHFLPLFVGTYSASPYRLDFQDFHPEKVLGFLPHELDFTHLRMLWRRWKKKARLACCGRPITPFGPEWLDRALSRLFGLKGDLVTDFRLIDYLVWLMSTPRSPALNGQPGNDVRLRRDLAAMGVFDPRMAMYSLYRMRTCDGMGFFGFEGRHYSQFSSLVEDLAGAADLQTLVTALAFRYILRGETGHADIPDDPFLESERRQVLFGAAIGIPTFYVARDTPNRFLRKILEQTAATRLSRRYPGYVRVHNLQYRLALLKLLKTDGADLIAAMGLEETIRHLGGRLEDPARHGAAQKLIDGILGEARKSSPMALPALQFNLAAEAYYRGTLRLEHMREAIDLLEEQFAAIDGWQSWRSGLYNRPLLALLKGRSAPEFLKSRRRGLLSETAASDDVRTLIQVCLLVFHRLMAAWGSEQTCLP